MTETLEEMKANFKTALQKARDEERPAIEAAINDLKAKAKDLNEMLNSEAFTNPLLDYPQELSQARNLVQQILSLSTFVNPMQNPAMMAAMALAQNQADLATLKVDTPTGS